MNIIKYLAIIPARGGSKRLPRKNVLSLHQKPLIAWSIETSLASEYISETIVSTDDSEIIEISKKHGAKVPFVRPSELSTDQSDSLSVVIHAVDFYKKQGFNIENIILLQPTSPLRITEDINEAIQLFEKEDANSVISVCETEHSPLWCNVLPENCSMDNFLNPEYKNCRSQDLPTYYRINGAIYIIKTSILEKERSFFSSQKSFSYIMPQNRSIDIDSKLDFIIAENLITNS
jgi:CMP-N-acetylneuraminic acid synthetase